MFCALVIYRNSVKNPAPLLFFMWNLWISDEFTYFCELYSALSFQNEIQNFFEKKIMFSPIIFYSVIIKNTTKQAMPYHLFLTWKWALYSSVKAWQSNTLLAVLIHLKK